MGKGARQRAAREQEGQRELTTLFCGTAGAYGAYIKTHGLVPAEQMGVLLFDDADSARDYALGATARLRVEGSTDQRALVVEVKLDPLRVTADPEVWGCWWARRGVRPSEVADMRFFDASNDLADEDFADALAARFDRSSEAWRRAATGEMEA